jgi:trigger factor
VASVAAPVKTTATQLAGSRVRLQVEVPPQEVRSRLEQKARALGRELRLPGFRRGKVPAPVVIQRLGREAVLEQAVRDALSNWYAAAIDSAEVVPVGDPKIELSELPPEGRPLVVSIEIGVLPKAELGSYLGVEAPRREPAVSEEQLSEQVQAMRDRLARLQTAQRPAQEGDFVVIDYVARQAGDGDSGEGAGARVPGGEGRDQLVEIGAGRAVAGLEQGLLGASAGEQRTVHVAFPPDHADEKLAGESATLEVAVKEVKVKELPALDEDFAIDAGYDSVEELREDIRRRLLELDEERVQAEFRQAALDAVVEDARVEVTPELASARANEMWERMLHGLAHRGVSREAYLRIAGRAEADLLAELQSEADLALRREAVLTAVVEAEGISPTDDELTQALAPAAEERGADPQHLLAELRAAGRVDEVREDLAARTALDAIADKAQPISVARAQAKERLWTPDQAGAGESRPGGERTPASAGAQPSGPGGLWTPSDR